MEDKNYKVVNIRFPKDEYDKIAALAKENGVTFSKAIRSMAHVAYLMITDIDGALSDYDKK